MEKDSCKKGSYSSGSRCYGTKTHEKTCNFLWYIHKLSPDKMCKIYYIYTNTLGLQAGNRKLYLGSYITEVPMTVFNEDVHYVFYSAQLSIYH